MVPAGNFSHINFWFDSQTPPFKDWNKVQQWNKKHVYKVREQHWNLPNLLWQQEHNHSGQLEYKGFKRSEYTKDDISMFRKRWHCKKCHEMPIWREVINFFLKLFKFFTWKKRITADIYEKSDYCGATTRIIARFFRVYPISWYIIFV